MISGLNCNWPACPLFCTSVYTDTQMATRTCIHAIPVTLYRKLLLQLHLNFIETLPVHRSIYQSFARRNFKVSIHPG